EKTDGQILAETLGIDSGVFQHIDKANWFTRRNTRAMNFCLWQATLGYYFEEMYAFFRTGDHLFNTYTDDDGSDTTKTDNEDMMENLDRIRDYMVDYVSGRGAMPNIRVGNQPYGFLPA